MTESDAKTKKCPLFVITQGIIAHAAVYAKVQGSEEESCQNLLKAAADSCIGSACMMWRWDTEERIPSAAGITMMVEREGHCGLAGKP